MIGVQSLSPIISPKLLIFCRIYRASVTCAHTHTHAPAHWEIATKYQLRVHIHAWRSHTRRVAAVLYSAYLRGVARHLSVITGDLCASELKRPSAGARYTVMGFVSGFSLSLSPVRHSRVHVYIIIYIHARKRAEGTVITEASARSRRRRRARAST